VSAKVADAVCRHVDGADTFADSSTAIDAGCPICCGGMAEIGFAVVDYLWLGKEKLIFEIEKTCSNYTKVSLSFRQIDTRDHST
jgi:hypothetical protein